jgi:heat shock protein beta
LYAFVCTGTYPVLFATVGKYLKVGAVEDDKNRKEIAPLLRFFSSKSGEEYLSLDDYVEAMPEGQKAIYFVTGDGVENASMSPAIEKLNSRGYDVLFATEPLDEIMMENLRSYKEKDIVDAAKENLRLDDDDDSKKKKEELREEFKQVAEYLEVLLKDRIQKVIVSDLLVDSPAALVQGAYGMSPTMQRYMKAQAVAAGQGDTLGDMNKAVLEINPNHPIVKDIDRLVKLGDNDAKELKDCAMLMYDVAAMTSGYDVPDMKQFAKRVLQLMDDKVNAFDGGTSETEATESTKSQKVDETDEVVEKVEEVEVESPSMKVTEAEIVDENDVGVLE